MNRKNRGEDRAVIARAVGTFLLTGLVAMGAIVTGVVSLVRHDVREDAIREARNVTAAAGRAAIAPVLTDAVVQGDPAALAAFDANVRDRVLSRTLVRVKVWTAGGRIIYSDKSNLIGQRFALSADDLAVMRTGRPAAGISNLREPENVSERSYGQLLQVYDGLRTTSGQPVLFEAYLTMDAIRNSSSLTTLVPVVVGAFIVLFMIQVPLAWRLARRVQRARDDRAAMLERTLRSRDAERRRIAADLHDGVVQQLAGSAYSLTAAADEAEHAGAHHAATTVRAAATELRQSVRDLRTLIITVTPPKVHEEGLRPAFEDLASSARSAGLVVELAIDAPPGASTDAEDLVFRTAQEALRNVVEHAQAQRVTVQVTGGAEQISLRVADDGIGFDATNVAVTGQNGQPHLGLRLLDELAQDAGGMLHVTSRPGGGTVIELEVPLQ